MSVINGVASEYEMPREPKFYQNENISLPIGSTSIGKLRVPYGERVAYEANNEGIVKSTETFDQDGEVIYASNQMIIPKEVFVEAYKKYIKDGEDK